MASFILWIESVVPISGFIVFDIWYVLATMKANLFLSETSIFSSSATTGCETGLSMGWLKGCAIEKEGMTTSRWLKMVFNCFSATSVDNSNAWSLYQSESTFRKRWTWTYLYYWGSITFFISTRSAFAPSSILIRWAPRILGPSAFASSAMMSLLITLTWGHHALW